MTLLNFEIVDEKFNKHFEPLLYKFKKIGFEYMSHGIIDLDGNTNAYFSHSQWAKLYANQKYGLSDPCMHLLMNTDRHMAMWNAMPRDFRQVDVMKERYRLCGIEDGISLYYRYPSGVKIIVGLGVKHKEQLLQFLLHPPIHDLQDLVDQTTKIHNKVKSI